MTRSIHGQFRRQADERPMQGEFRQDVPAARPSAAFEVLLSLAQRRADGEISEADYRRRVDAVKADERAAILAGRALR